MDGRIRLPSLGAGAEAAGGDVTEATGAEVHSAEDSVVAMAGWRLYALVAFVGAPLAMLLLGVVGAAVVAGGYPGSEGDVGATEAVAWRLLHNAVIFNGPRAVALALPFAFTFKLTAREQARMAGGLAAGWAIFYILTSLYLGDRSPAAQACLISAGAIFAPLLLLPVWLVRAKDKRGAASSTEPLMRPVYVVVACLSATVTIVRVALPRLGDMLFFAWLALSVISTAVAFHKDRPEDVQPSEWYTAMLVTVAVALPRLTSAIVDVLLDNLDQADSLQSLATASTLGLFMAMVHAIQYALARRAFAPRFRAVALFPIQVFEDMYGEFFFVESGVYSGGFFVLLALQVTRSLGRDTGLFSEAWRLIGNVWRRWRGEAVVKRAADASVEWARIWLQNMVSEMSAAFLFLGTLLAEDAFELEEARDGDGSMVGELTGLGRGARSALAGGYGVVLVVEVCAHAFVFMWLRRLLVREQARVAAAIGGTVSLSAEAGQLLRNNGVFLVATLLYTGANTLFYIRSLRVPVL